MYFFGIDIGSLSCDAVLIDEHGKIIASTVVPTGARNREAIERAKLEVGDRGGLSSLLNNLEVYRKLRPKRDALSSEIARTEKRLREAGQEALGESDSASLQRRLDEIGSHNEERQVYKALQHRPSESEATARLLINSPG